MAAVLLICWLVLLPLLPTVLPRTAPFSPGRPLPLAGWPGASSPSSTLTPYPPRPTGGPRDCPQADSPENSTPVTHPPPALDRPALAESGCRGLSLSLRSLSLASQMPLPLLHCWLAGNDVAFCCSCTSCCCSKTCVQGPAADEEGVGAVLMVRSWTERPRKA